MQRIAPLSCAAKLEAPFERHLLCEGRSPSARRSNQHCLTSYMTIRGKRQLDDSALPLTPLDKKKDAIGYDRLNFSKQEQPRVSSCFSCLILIAIKDFLDSPAADE